MLNIKFAPPSIFGIDWQNPEHIREYQQSQNIALQNAFRQIGNRANNPNYIVVEGESIQDLPEIRTEADVLEAIGIADLTSAEVDQLENIGTSTISAAQWGFVGGMNQGVATGDSPTFANSFSGEFGDLAGVVITTPVADNELLAFDFDSGNWINQTPVEAKVLGLVGGAMTGAITTNSTFDGRNVGQDGLDLDKLYTTIGLSDLTVDEVNQLENIDTTAITTTQWGYVGNMNQGVDTVDNVQFAQLTITSIVIGANTINTSEWAYLDGLDQSVGTVDAVAFGSINIGGSVLDSTEWSLLDGLDQSVNVGSNVSFGNITVSEDAWHGISSGGERIGFDGTSGHIDILDATLDLNTNAIIGVADITLTTGEGEGDITNGTTTLSFSSVIGVFGGALALNGNAITGVGILTTTSGRIVNTTRITGNTTLGTTHHNVFADTDGGALTVTLPAGVDGTEYRIINVGASGKDVTVAPDGAELLLGTNSNLIMSDGDVLVITYETTEGWY